MTIGREGKKRSKEIIPKRVRLRATTLQGAIKKGPILLSPPYISPGPNLQNTSTLHDFLYQLLIKV